MVSFPPVFIGFELVTPRGPGGGLLGLKDGLEKMNKSVSQVYRLGGQKFLERAAEELENIPSSRRYKAWHVGKVNTDPFASSVSLANRITSSRNIVIKENGSTATVSIFDTTWMNSVAPHWSALEYGSHQNVINASTWRIAFRHPGGRGLHAPGGDPVGKLVRLSDVPARRKKGGLHSGPKQKMVRYVGGGGLGRVQEPIRAGHYLRESYNATIRHKLENELRSRIRASFGNVHL